MPFVAGFLRNIHPGTSPETGLPEVEGPTDPGYGLSEEAPSQGPVAPSGPTDPGFGYPLPPVINGGTPERPPHVSGTPPSHVSGGPIRPPSVWGPPSLPTYPVDPGFDLPSRPHVWPQPPNAGVWPPAPPIHPSAPIYPAAGHPSTGPVPGVPPAPAVPPPPPGSVYPPLPPSIQGPIICLCWIINVGYRWVVLDPKLEIPDGKPDAPSAQPRR
jgi:hypothetical protein